METKYKRRIYWILPDFQKRFMIRHLGLAGLNVFLTAAIVVLFIIWQDHVLRAQFYMVTNQAGQDPVVLSRWQIVLPSVLFAGALVLFLTSIVGVFYSHRLAGPIFHMKRTVEAIAQGKKVDQIHLREKDEFKELAEAINHLIQRHS